jgi:uncharacterized protein YcfJ
MVLLLCGLGAAGLLIIAAAAELSIQAERADQATNLAEVAAWQVSQVLEDVRRITREAAARQARGELP